MIKTITFNPSLDYFIKVKDFEKDQINLIDEEHFFAGGKGINVSIMLQNLGVENTALGFIAGFTGDEIIKKLKSKNVSCDFIRLKNGLSRVNVKLKSNEETEINGRGPEITDEDLKVLFAKIDDLKEGDFLVLSGSIPKCLSDDIYEKIMKDFSGRGIEFVVDAAKDLLLNVLKYRPFLIKPNHHELADMFNAEIKNDEDIIKYAKKLQKMGAKNVLVSMAAEGALFIPENGTPVKKKAPDGKAENSVGAGDSMLAGFLAGYLKNNDLYEGLRLSLAAGSASALSDDIAEADKVYKILKEVE